MAVIDGEKIMTCPVQTITPESIDALGAFGFYNDGHLPEAGGYLAQPNYIMEQIMIVKAAWMEAKAEKKKK